MRPATEADLAQAIRESAEPFEIVGGGTRRIGNPVTGIPLETAALSGITLYEPGALTLVARAGTPLAEIEAALAAEGQMLPFEPLDFSGAFGLAGGSSIGGVVATNSSGPRRIQAGACRDLLLGVRFVDGRGEVLKNGGRVMKNVTGYDLVKLMAGSYGTLGVLTEVSFKVLPSPETSTTLVVQGRDAAQAVKAMSAALASPYDVSGALYLPNCGTHIRLEGFAGSVQHRSQALKSKLAAFGEVAVVGDSPVWAQARQVESFAGRESALWRVSLKPTDAPGFLAAIGGGGQFSYQLDWGGGLIWLWTEGDAAALHARLQDKVGSIGGHATLIRGSDDVKRQVSVFQPEPAPLGRIAGGLRRQFDPRGLLNPGRMG